ncbi:Gp49 family protein [Pseudomonas viridiflava]|uniref:Gp49 family protein n=1 Tax=Pseudomonas viridiflava TaxID=33069 RepID=UPI002EA983AC|nr:Gp49 family protein [Pseudomonas viridiflava]
MSDSVIDKEIQEKGLTALRVTPADLSSNIVGETYFTAADGVLGAYKNHDDVYQGTDVHNTSYALLTFCVLVLRNGFTVTGESACASPENFDAEIGRKIARQNAEQKIWPLMGYALKQQIHEAASK